MLTLLARSLTPRRLKYAWLLGVVLWGAWLFSLILGPGNVDLAGQAIGTDYLAVYAIGRTLLLGHSPQLYDIVYQQQMQQATIGPGFSAYYAALTPPFYAWIFVPFSVFPYTISFALWSVLGLVMLYLSFWFLGVIRLRQVFLWSLTFFPVFASVSYGENALLTLFLLSGTYKLWRDEHPFLAGLLCSLTLYKPQLCVGVAVLWLLSWRRDWRALAGLGVGGVALVGLCFGLLPEASWAYLEFARTVLPDLPNWQEFPLWHLHTVRGFWRLLLPAWPRVGDMLTLLAAALGLWAFIRWERRFRESWRLMFGAAIALTLWLTPHAMIYDWALWLIPALLLWEVLPQYRDRWRALFACMWLVALLSGPLTVAQLRVLPFALQLSVPVLALVLFQVGR